MNNPPLNLITQPLTGQLLQATAALEQGDSVRTVVVSGAGDRAFSIGSDLKELPAVRERVVEQKLPDKIRIFEASRSWRQTSP